MKSLAGPAALDAAIGISSECAIFEKTALI